jgi:hypothetical protein
MTAPIPQRRGFGQILRSAFRLQLENWRLFLGIGVLYVPLGMLAALVQSLLLHNPPVEPVVELLNSSLTDATAAFALGAIEFGLAYWLVLNATIAAVGEMAAGRGNSIRGAYEIEWRELKDLALARVSRLIIIVLLSVTIVGIPVAIYLGIRWLFIEHAVILEHRTWHEAPGASVQIVREDWLRAFGAVAAIVLAGLFVGPVVGMALLLLTSTSLAFVNIVSSVFYVALIPYVGIALTLLYYDLKLKHEGSSR